MVRTAMVNLTGEIVDNVIELEPGADIIFAAIFHLVEVTAQTGPANIGDTWDGTVFVPRVKTQEERDRATDKARINALREKLQASKGGGEFTSSEVVELLRLERS